MAKSKAKKLREKIEREGKMNPDKKRSPFASEYDKMRTKTTSTKKTKLDKQLKREHDKDMEI